MVFDEVNARFPSPKDENEYPTMEMHERVFATFMAEDFMKDFRTSVSSFNSLHSSQGDVLISQDNILLSNSSINDIDTEAVADMGSLGF